MRLKFQNFLKNFYFFPQNFPKKAPYEKLESFGLAQITIFSLGLVKVKKGILSSETSPYPVSSK